MALDYKELFAQVKAELQGIHKVEANLENALAVTASQREAMEKTYNAIAPLVGEEPLPTLKSFPNNADIEVLQAAGISVAVRALLDASPGEDFTAASVRDRLAEKGWVWENYKNPQATVYTTLVRLSAGSTAAVRETTVDGKKAFYSTKRVEQAESSARLKEVLTKAGGSAFALNSVTLQNPGIASILKLTEGLAAQHPPISVAAPNVIAGVNIMETLLGKRVVKK